MYPMHAFGNFVKRIPILLGKREKLHNFVLDLIAQPRVFYASMDHSVMVLTYVPKDRLKKLQALGIEKLVFLLVYCQKHFIISKRSK